MNSKENLHIILSKLMLQFEFYLPSQLYTYCIFNIFKLQIILLKDRNCGIFLLCCKIDVFETHPHQSFSVSVLQIVGCIKVDNFCKLLERQRLSVKPATFAFTLVCQGPPCMLTVKYGGDAQLIKIFPDTHVTTPTHTISFFPSDKDHKLSVG